MIEERTGEQAQLCSEYSSDIKVLTKRLALIRQESALKEEEAMRELINAQRKLNAAMSGQCASG